MKKLTLFGDLSLAGVDEQIPPLIQQLAEAVSAAPGTEALDLEIDLSGITALDACGCQLLAALGRHLEQRGGKFSLRLPEDSRKKIHMFGFAHTLLPGEST